MKNRKEMRHLSRRANDRLSVRNRNHVATKCEETFESQYGSGTIILKTLQENFCNKNLMDLIRSGVEFLFWQCSLGFNLSFA